MDLMDRIQEPDALRLAEDKSCRAQGACFLAAFHGQRTGVAGFLSCAESDIRDAWACHG